jgi:hypothetical protein
MQELQAEARLAAPSVAEPPVAPVAQLVLVGQEVPVLVVLVEPSVPADQTEVEELLAALELAAQAAKVPCVWRTLCATQATSRWARTAQRSASAIP